jgi:hypothetical protein
MGHDRAATPQEIPGSLTRPGMTHVARKAGLLRRFAPRNDEGGPHQCSRHRHARAAVPDLIENDPRIQDFLPMAKTWMTGTKPGHDDGDASRMHIPHTVIPDGAQRRSGISCYRPIQTRNAARDSGFALTRAPE